MVNLFAAPGHLPRTRRLLLITSFVVWSFALHPSANAAIVIYNGIDSIIAAERDDVIAEIGGETLPSNDPFVESTYMTVSPGWNSVQISFLSEGAGYANDFGWFLFDYDGNNYSIIDSGLLFDNILETPEDELGNPTGSGTAGAVASGTTFTLTPEAGDSDYYVGWYLQNPEGHTFYSINELNPNQEDHFGAATMTGGLVGYYMGIEDLLGLGDHDYNDVIFYTNPDVGLDSNPSVPEPSHSALIVAACLPIFLIISRRKKAAPASPGCYS